MSQLVFQDDRLELWHGDYREILPQLEPQSFDLCLADPPYGQTSLPWDAWPMGWPGHILPAMKPDASLWVCGSMRVFLDHAADFADWRFAQDVIWQKQNGTSPNSDRFRRIHEQVLHFYRGSWRLVYHETQHTHDAQAKTVRRKQRPPHWGDIGAGRYQSVDHGPRQMRSILEVKNCHGGALHPTEKPTALLEPLIAYACPPNGRVLVPFAGSGSELEAARNLGRQAVGIEVSPDYCDVAVRRLQQEQLRLLV